MSTQNSQPHSATTIRRRKNCRSLRRRDGLIQYARNNTSQNGEDGIIARLFNELLPLPPPPSPSSSSSSSSSHPRRRYCVDVGAWDGVHLSNTHSLLVMGDRDVVDLHHQDQHQHQKANEKVKWNGVLIEAEPQRFRELKQLHEPLGNTCICAEVSCQPFSSRSLSSILNRDAPYLSKEFDFLSIDVDGMDYWIMADILGLPIDNEGGNNDSNEDGGNTNTSSIKGYRPKVICIEFNPTMPMDLIYIQPRDDSVRHGSSLSAMVELATAADYTLVETTLFNAFFVQNQLYEEYLTKEVPDTSIEALHEITMGTELYQLYDGTVKLWGCRKMLWHRFPMDEERIQMLPAEERLFPFAPMAGSVSATNNGGSKGGRKKNITKDDDVKARDAHLKREAIRGMAIDMSSYCHSSRESNNNNNNNTILDRSECSAKLNKSLQTDGFALVKGTRIPKSMCDSALQAAKAFLHDADESVRRSCLTKDRARRGYSPMCTENFASLAGMRGPNDLVKKFRIGPVSKKNGEDHGGGEDDDDDDANGRGRAMLSSLHRPNAWPTEEVWGDETASVFRSVVEEYYERMCHAADCILKAICDGIAAENAEISSSLRRLLESTNNSTDRNAIHGNESDDDPHHTSILTLLGYQPGSRHKKGSKGYMRPLVSAHTDVGMITVLLFDAGRCASLQRVADASDADPESEEWIDVDLPVGGRYDDDDDDDDPVFVVNVGDCLSELSGGSLRSTLHRVVPRPCTNVSKEEGEEESVVRTCLALFVGLEPWTSLALPSGEVVTYEQWRKDRIARATAVLKNR